MHRAFVLTPETFYILLLSLLFYPQAVKLDTWSMTTQDDQLFENTVHKYLRFAVRIDIISFSLFYRMGFIRK
jgi:hypothetical protein